MELYEYGSARYSELNMNQKITCQNRVKPNQLVVVVVGVAGTRSAVGLQTRVWQRPPRSRYGTPRRTLL